jgi:hypothetical protein
MQLETLERAELLQEGPRSVLRAALDQVYKQWPRFLILPPNADTALTLWAAGTHLGRESDFFPRLAITAPLHNSGKSKTLSVLCRLVGRGIDPKTGNPHIFSNITGPGLFRLIDLVLGSGGTFLLDEADNLGLEDNRTLCAVLNAGVDPDGATIVRCVGDDYQPKFFDVRGWLGIAKIGSVEPATLRSRCIVINLMRATNPPPELLGAKEKAELVAVGKQLGEAVRLNFKAILHTTPSLPPVLKNRSADKWRRLIAIADVAGGLWPERARKAAVELSEGDAEPETWTEGNLLLDALELALASNSDPIPIDEMKAFAHGAGLGSQNFEPNERLGRKLSSLGLRSDRPRGGPFRDRRVYRRDAIRQCLVQQGRLQGAPLTYEKSVPTVPTAGIV